MSLVSWLLSLSSKIPTLFYLLHAIQDVEHVS